MDENSNVRREKSRRTRTAMEEWETGIWLQDSRGDPIIYLKTALYSASSPPPPAPPVLKHHPPQGPLQPALPTPPPPCRLRKYATAMVTAAPYCALASPQTLRALRTFVMICRVGMGMMCVRGREWGGRDRTFWVWSGTYGVELGLRWGRCGHWWKESVERGGERRAGGFWEVCNSLRRQRSLETRCLRWSSLAVAIR